MKKAIKCQLIDLGMIDYLQALDIQREFLQGVISRELPDTLIVCQHPHVITLSRRAKRENILVPQERLQELGVAVCPTDRGGDVTYHGPGQLVIYPIFDLRHGEEDIHLYLRKLEEVVIRALRDNFGLNAYRKQDLIGIWVGPYKVGSIGIALRHWVTYHGVSLNVGVDKRYFSLIKPCGLDVQMASLNDFFSDEVAMTAVRGMIIEKFKDVFNLSIMEGAGDGKSLLTGSGRER